MRSGRGGNPFDWRPQGSGMRLGFGPGLPLPPVVKQLLILNVAVFVVTRLLGVDLAALHSTLGLVPADVFGSGRVWQLGTYMFLHSSLMHLLFNMLMLWMFGTTVEHQWGSSPFAWYYAVCGLGGALTMWIMGPTSTVATIGASAAVLGVVLAYGLMYPNRQVMLYFIIPIRMKYLIWIIAGIDLLAAFDGRQDGIAHFAHLGGMLFGYLYLKQDWRLGHFGSRLGSRMRAQRARMKMQQNARAAEKERASQEEIDRILDKIHREGMDSLTEQELKILREASRH